MAMYRYGNANVVKASITGDQWTNNAYKDACKDGQCRMKTARSVIAKYSPDKYLLSHVTIISSVDVELADHKDPKSDYLIHPEFSKFVNNNGDAWTAGVIKNSYKSFIGGNNFLEHVQIDSLSKGKIIDAALREIVVGKDKNGKELTTNYVDILVATDRKHEDLVRKIQSGEYSQMSMGCMIRYSICSKCGNKAADETEACDHVRYQKSNMFFDDNGVQRKIAELCFPWNVKVLTDTGYKYIEGIKKDDIVITHTGDKHKVLETISREFIGDFISIKAEGLHKRFESTPEHPYYVYDGKQFSFKAASELVVGDYLVSRGPLETKNIDEINEDRAKLLGLYISEGYAYNGYVEFSFNSLDEYNLAQETSVLLEKEFPPEINKNVPNKNHWTKILNEGIFKKVRRTKHGLTLVDKNISCPICDAPYEYIVFKRNRIKCVVCGSQTSKNRESILKKPHVYICDRKYNQNSIGDRLISKDNSKKLSVRYNNKNCFDFFKKYCSGNRAFNKSICPDLIYAPLGIQKIILTNWLKGDGSIDSELRLRGYTTSENIFYFMKTIASRLNYWTRGQVLFDDKLVDLGDLRNQCADFDQMLDSKKSHTRFVLYFSPRDDKDLVIESGMINSYPNKRPETRKKDGFLFHKIKLIEIKKFSGSVFNLKVDKDNSFIVDSIVTHNCGHESDPESVKFIEASWVRQPAFTGAVLRSFVEPSDELMEKLEAANKMQSYKTKAGDYLKAATDKGLIAQDPEKTDPGAEAAPEDTPPPEDAPAAEDVPADEPLPPEMVEEEDDIKVFKKDLKKKVLKQVQDEVLKDLSDEDSEGPRELETLDETLIKPASLVLSKVWGAQKTWDRFIGQKLSKKLEKKSFDKLRYGVHIAMTNSDLTVLKDYGYNKRDFLAVLSFIDSCFKNPLPFTIKKTIAKLGGMGNKTPEELLRQVVADLDRKITRKEAIKTLSWLRLLDFYT